jgi:hypothetical protein
MGFAAHIYVHVLGYYGDGIGSCCYLPKLRMYVSCITQQLPTYPTPRSLPGAVPQPIRSHSPCLVNHHPLAQAHLLPHGELEAGEISWPGSLRASPASPACLVFLTWPCPSSPPASRPPTPVNLLGRRLSVLTDPLPESSMFLSFLLASGWCMILDFHLPDCCCCYLQVSSKLRGRLGACVCFLQPALCLLGNLLFRSCLIFASLSLSPSSPRLSPSLSILSSSLVLFPFLSLLSFLLTHVQPTTLSSQPSQPLPNAWLPACQYGKSRAYPKPPTRSRDRDGDGSISSASRNTGTGTGTGTGTAAETRSLTGAAPTPLPTHLGCWCECECECDSTCVISSSQPAYLLCLPYVVPTYIST